MNSDEDDFFSGAQPSVSGLTLSHMNNKSSVLCPETQDITSQYLALQQLDAHQKMISRAKGCIDTTAPKSMQSFRSVSSQRKNKLLQHMKNESPIPLQTEHNDEHRKPSPSKLTAYTSEEDENESINASFVNKAIQAGIPVSNFTCKTAEKISWYLEALSLGELQSQYFAFMDANSTGSRGLVSRNSPGLKGKKRIIRGDIMDWHQEHFLQPRKPFSPRILADTTTESKVRGMRCYNPPFRKKKLSSSQSSDTFESYDEEENEDEIRETNQNRKASDNSFIEEDETLISRRLPETETLYSRTVPLSPRYNHHHDPTALSKNEEEKYLDFLSKVTEDILRSGVYSDKAIQQAFEFHLQFYKDDSNKEKLQSLLEQVLEGLNITDVENHENRSTFLFPRSTPCTPPEKETSSVLFTKDTFRMPTELNSITNEPTNNDSELNLNNS